jgi:hypothetical protein
MAWQEYHAPSVLASPVADILNNAGLFVPGPLIAFLRREL